MCKKSSVSNLPKKTALYILGDFILSMPVRLALMLLRIYQWTVSPLKRFFFGPSCGCRFQPTCSCYAYDAFANFGFWKGFWFTLRRLLRCHPWHPGGSDPLHKISSSK